MPLSPHQFIATTRDMARLGSRTEKSFLQSALAPALDTPGRRGDVRLIDHCGFTSHFDAQNNCSDWPIPTGMTVNELADFAEDGDLLTATPEPGDIFLQYSPIRKEFIHAGIVVDVTLSARLTRKARFYEVYTIEGDVDQNGWPGGGRTMKIRRHLSSAFGDRFIRWSALGAEAADPDDVAGSFVLNERSA